MWGTRSGAVIGVEAAVDRAGRLGTAADFLDDWYRYIILVRVLMQSCRPEMRMRGEGGESGLNGVHRHDGGDWIAFGDVILKVPYLSDGDRGVAKPHTLLA
ncbi:hypothetical protein N825_29570 [Skermanella stibiiresistens SB22]|uniref:Uncharacterized protein n=1 Tax=Skermanella stibiiresistens SB22 TaxID=1385369 RepID=W9GUM2_9PROT|nr:hypothetical protein N825_29570 [Skermanella stibiiresistens SB22]